MSIIISQPYINWKFSNLGRSVHICCWLGNVFWDSTFRILSLIFISLCHDNVSCTISRNFWKKENKRKKWLPINLLQQKHSLAELWDEFQVLIMFTEPRKWGSLQKPCYCERWLHRKPHFFPSDRRTAGAWQPEFRQDGWRAGSPGTLSVQRKWLSAKLLATCITAMS